MKNKLISLLLTGTVLISSLLTGCGSAETKSTASSNNSNKTSVSFWALNTKQRALDPIVEKFNEDNEDVEVKVSYYDVDGIKDSCKVAASSNTLPTMWFNWGGSLAKFYVDNGLTYDLTEYSKSHGWEEKFISTALDLCTFDDKLSGYPQSYNVIGMFYRNDIFKENGIEIPTTFEEFEKACATLKDKGIVPISTAGLNGWHVMRFVELLFEYYAGPEKHDALNNFEESWDCEEVVQALTKYKEFCDKGYFPKGFLTIDPNDTKLLFYTGEAAMDIQGQWEDGAILSDGQDINLYDVFSVPTVGTNRLSAFAEMIQINAKSSEEEVEACMKFLDYYFSEDVVKEYSEYYNLPLPVVGAEMPEGQPNVEKLINISNENGTFTITDQAFPNEVADVLFNVQDSIANGAMTPEEGAKEIQKGIEAYLNK